MGKASNPLVKNQHYIPRCILSNFSNDNSQIYEGLVSTKQLYLTNISNAMMERFTYEHSIFQVNFLEKHFSRIEDYLGPAVKEIIQKIDTCSANYKKFKDIHNLINKYMREFLIFYYRSGALLFEFSQSSNSAEDRVLLMVRKIISSKYIRGLSETITKYYSFCILKCDDGKFVVSDQFISTATLGIKNRFFNVSNRQMGFKSVLILIPISKNYYVAYYNGKSPAFLRDNRINVLTEDQEREINYIIVNNSYNKCICNNEGALKKSLAQFEIDFPTKFIAGYKSGRTEGATVKKEIFYYDEDKKIMDSFESADWLKYKSMSRNDRCKCGSGKKFKDCHQDLFTVANRMMNDIENNTSEIKHAVSPHAYIELPIDEWAGSVKADKNKPI